MTLELTIPALGIELRYWYTIPVTIPVTLVRSASVRLRMIQARTQRCGIHQAGEGNGPVIHGVDNVATIELG